MNGWPKPKEVSRQIWIATYAVELEKLTGVNSRFILTKIKLMVTRGEADTAEEALRHMYQAYELPAPGTGQLYLIIQDGALVAPGEESDL